MDRIRGVKLVIYGGLLTYRLEAVVLSPLEYLWYSKGYCENTSCNKRIERASSTSYYLLCWTKNLQQRRNYVKKCQCRSDKLGMSQCKREHGLYYVCTSFYYW